ncbi:MAG: glucosamine-6-phosphate deaminase [Planctomycetota bacterium]|nr:MAG: glucosamine-6-phosphate deaminase [Planctomycetota bacterium]
MSRIRVFAGPAEAGAAAATEIAALVRAKPDAVLGLATGATPLPLYRELVRRHREEGLDLSRVRTFNLDEYWPIDPEHPASFRRAMLEHLIRPAGIPEANFHIPDGRTPPERLVAAAEAYEQAIAAAGGIDLQVLGLGLNGHVGFNEPGSHAGSRTRLVELAEQTRRRAAAAFPGEEPPRHGLTVGLATIRSARRLRILAFGREKAAIVARAVGAAPDPAVPATLLVDHPDLEWFLDRAAAARLPDRV